MPRVLTQAQKDYVGPIVWLADITTRAGAAHYFAEDQLSFGGNAYLPYLRLSSGVRLARALRTDSAELELINTDLVVGDLLQTEDFEGALCVLRQLQVGLDAAFIVLRGLLTEQEEAEQAVRFRLISELDPARIDVPSRLYANLCTWQFGRTGRNSPCRHDPSQNTLATNLSPRTADIFSATTIGDSTLAEAVDVPVARLLTIVNGTGVGQSRRIKSNTATTFTLYSRWATNPDGTSSFRVSTVTFGAPKNIPNAVTGFGGLQGGVNIFSARTIGHSDFGMAVDEHAGDRVRIVSGAGAGQERKIGSNTATTITIDAAEADFSPAPDATSFFRVFYRTCPKDFAPSCEERGRTEDFNGFPTLVPILGASFRPPGGGGGGRGDGEDDGGRGRRDNNPEFF